MSERNKPPASCNGQSEFVDECDLEKALSNPDNDEVFYSASMHFLQERLRQRASSQQYSQKDTCTSNMFYKKINRKSAHTDIRLLAHPPTLSIEQVLPFPKASGETLFKRLKGSFKKPKPNAVLYDLNEEEHETSPTTSKFRFPRIDSSRNREPGRSGSKDGVDHLSDGNASKKVVVSYCRENGRLRDPEVGIYSPDGSVQIEPEEAAYEFK